MDIARFQSLPVMGILRGIDQYRLEPLLTQAVIPSGLQALEITMNTSGAAGLIQKTVVCAAERLMIGAGTVLTMDHLKAALDAGAGFIVSPVFVPEVVEYCVKSDVPVFPGALTPQEIHTAWRAGAAMVKVFPAKFFGPGYFKEVKAPLDRVRLLACGGVSVQTAAEYKAAGADAIAFGASIFRKEWLQKEDFPAIKESIESLIRAFRG